MEGEDDEDIDNCHIYAWPPRMLVRHDESFVSTWPIAKESSRFPELQPKSTKQQERDARHRESITRVDELLDQLD